MPVFLYKAQNTQGNQFSGEIEAKDKNEAESLLRRKHLVVESLKRRPIENQNNSGSSSNTKEAARYTRMFSSMTSAGLPIL